MRLFLKLALTVMLAAGCLVLPFTPQNTFPFELQATGDHGYRIKTSSLGLPLPPDLRTGDILRLDKMDFDSRALLVGSIGNPPAGTGLTLQLERDGQIVSAPVELVPLPPTLTNRLTLGAGYALIWLLTALGLLLLWRGRHRAAAGVAVWCLTASIGDLAGNLSIVYPYSRWVSTTSVYLATGGTLLGLMLVADALAGVGHMHRWGRWRWHGFFALLAVYFVLVITTNTYVAFTGIVWPYVQPATIAVHLAAFALPLTLLVYRYRQVAAENRARIRWILFSISGLVAVYLANILPQFVPISSLAANLAIQLLTGAAFCGFTYAVLRHQLVSIRLVVNRALAYGIVTTLVVGAFAAITSLVERSALGPNTNKLLELIIPLILGIALHTVKRHVDDYLNRLFFRHRYRAEATLSDFARTCGYIDQPAELLRLTADEMFRHSGAEGVAIIRTETGGAGTRVEQRGKSVATQTVAANDLALVRLRAGDAEVDLHSTSTALGTDGYAFPLSVRGNLLGVLVCGSRPAEQYTKEERKLFGHVAHEVGVALSTLELQEQQKLLKALADGAFRSLPAARSRARSLLGMQASA